MYKKILVTLDWSERAEAVLPHAEGAAKAFDAEIVLLMIIEPLMRVIGAEGAIASTIDVEATQKFKHEAEGYLNYKAEVLREAGLKARAVLMVGGPVVEAIIQIAGEENADLIAMASHGRSGLGYVFYGSVAAGVLNRVDRPLLLIRSRD